MDWNRIKTIFILTFLLLDIYLAFQFIKVRDIHKYGFLTEASVEDRLTNDNIKIDVELPKVLEKQQYVSADPKVFTKEDVKALDAEHVTIGDGKSLRVNLEKPVKINSKPDIEELNTFIKSSVPFGDQYQFWEMNEQLGMIIYYQKLDNKFIFQNPNGKITIFLNENSEITGFVQTYLNDFESMTEEQEVIPPIRAIESLYKQGLLKPKSIITNINLGYSTLVELSASQVLAPTWQFEIDEKESLYVNAIEGHVVQLNHKEN